MPSNARQSASGGSGARGGTGSRRGSGGGSNSSGSNSNSRSASRDVLDKSARNSSGASEHGSDGGASGKPKAGKKGSKKDAEARKRDKKARAAARKRERRAESKLKAAQANADDKKEAPEKLPPLRMAINSPGMGWLQPVQNPSRHGGGGGGGGSGGSSGDRQKKAPSPAAVPEASEMAASSPESRARIERINAAADVLAARVASGGIGGAANGANGGGGGPSSDAVVNSNVGGPWAHAAGAKSAEAANGGPMKPEVIAALFRDPEKTKLFINNLIVGGSREMDCLKRKRDQLLGERKRLARDHSKAEQRHNAALERRSQPSLPVDDSLLGTLKPLAEGTAVAERPQALKRLSIIPDVSGSLLRAWDFLHLNSQMITLSPFSLDDFADSLHYSGDESVMMTEVHTRLLSVILRDGKFPKSLSAALDPAASGTVPVASSSVFVGAATRAAAAAAAAAAAGTVSQGSIKHGAALGKAIPSKKGLHGTPSGKGKRGCSASRPNHDLRRAPRGAGGGQDEEQEEEDEQEEGDEGDEGDEAWMTALLPPRSERNEQHDNAYNLVTALSWPTVLAMALPHMGPYARAVAPPTPTVGSFALCLAAAPAGTSESKRGTTLAVEASERAEADRVARGKALARARRGLLEKEYCSLPLQEKALLLEVLVDTAYETKRIRSMLAENMAARMSLESQRREEIIAYNREIREKATAQKNKVQAQLRKSNEKMYMKRAADAEKDRAKRAAELGLMGAAAVANGSGAGSAGGGEAAGAGGGGGGGADGAGKEGAGAKSKSKSKKGKGKTGDAAAGGGGDVATLTMEGGGQVKVNPKVFEPDRGQLQSGMLEDTVKESCGGEYKLRAIEIPDDDVDPFEAEQLEEDKKTKKVMLENLSRIELIQRRREKDARDKERNKRRQEWKEARLQRANQAKALQTVKNAVSQGGVQVLEEAIREGRRALLEEDDGHGTLFLCPEMRDAYVALATAKERKGREAILDKYRGLMSEKFVRTEPLGLDRHGRRYWVFEGDSRIHVEVITRKKDVPSLEATTAPSSTAVAAIESDAVSAKQDDKTGDNGAVKPEDGGEKPRGDDGNDGNAGAGAGSSAESNGAASSSSASSAKEAQQLLAPNRVPHPPMEAYHPVWSDSVWMYYDTAEEFLKLILSLDRRGKREGELRQALEERFNVAELDRNAKERDPVVPDDRAEWQADGSDYIGKRVKRVFGRRIAGATVVKWMPKESNQGLALWHVRHDDGDEEDLEEFEVKEGMAMADADDKVGSTPGSALPALVKEAMDGSLNQAFAGYTNRLNKMQAIKERDLGISALQEALLHREAGMLDDIKDRTRDYAKGSNASTPRGMWLRLVKEASRVSDVKEAILTLEETLRGLQEGEDKMEGGRMELEAKGWNFSPDAHPLIGRRCRRFFKDFGKSDCTVAAHLPAQKGDPELWHVVHDDGDEEDLEEHELDRARKYLDEDVREMPEEEEEDREGREDKDKDNDKDNDKDDDEEEDGSQDEKGRDGDGEDDDGEDDDDEEEEDEEESDDEEGLTSCPTQSRATLWENWGARQGWVKGIKGAKTVGTLALGFLTLVESAFLFGIGKESMLEANRSRARMAKAWETPGKSGKSSRRAAAVAASAAISNFASTDMDVDRGNSPSGAGSGKRRSSRRESGGGSADKRQRR